MGRVGREVTVQEMAAVVGRGAIELSTVPVIGAEGESGGHGGVGLGFGDGRVGAVETHEAEAYGTDFLGEDLGHGFLIDCLFFLENQSVQRSSLCVFRSICHLMCLDKGDLLSYG